MGCCEHDILSHLLQEDSAYTRPPTLFELDIGVEHECRSTTGFSTERIQAFCDPEHGSFGEFQGPKSSCSERRQAGINSDQEYQSPSPSSVDWSLVEIDFEECQSPTFSISTFLTDEHGEQEFRSPDVHIVPQVGMEFESEDHAYNYYSRYAVSQGFSIQKDFLNKSRTDGLVVSRKYICYRQGHWPTQKNASMGECRKETRTGCLAHMTIARQPNGRLCVTQFEPKHNHELVTPSATYLLPIQKRLNFAEAVEADLRDNSGTDGVPKLGMWFGSEDHAYEFYSTYAGRVGFSVRKDYVNKSKVDAAVVSRRFTCFRQGFRKKDKQDINVKRPRKETRIGCLAELIISRQPDGKYRVTRFEEKHNHELLVGYKVCMLQSQKRLVADQPQLASELICKTERDCVSHDFIDYKSKLPSKRMRDMSEAESARLQQYFRSKQLKEPTFFCALQPDVDDQVANVFWADTKMVTDYSDFGDVICLDTTYRLQEDCRPFTPIIGINHHKQIMIFGAALLYDESVESYQWLFQTFLVAMSGKNPKTILTDQDAVLFEAIDKVFPQIPHRTCVWHVYKNALKELSYMSVTSSCFINDLSSCLFDYEHEEDFINAWNRLLDLYGLWENVWLYEMFENRENWAIPYGRDHFCADIKAALLHGSFTEKLRKYLKSDSDVGLLFKQLGKVVKDWHYKELQANFHLPELMGDVILLKQAKNIYTASIFELFQQEYETSLNIVANLLAETESLFEYKVSMYGQPREYMVTFDSSTETVACNCMKFEFMGVLCSHALKVLDYRNIKILPSQYILKRWSKKARA